jgi:hypothetical protein
LLYQIRPWLPAFHAAKPISPAVGIDKLMLSMSYRAHCGLGPQAETRNLHFYGLCEDDGDFADVPDC